MLTMSNGLKTAAFAGLLGLAAFAASTAPAAAYTYTRCDSDGDRCYRVHCDYDGDDCWRSSGYYTNSYYSGRHWVCDEDGDDCHWAYSRYYSRPYYARPSIGLSFGFHD